MSGWKCWIERTPTTLLVATCIRVHPYICTNIYIFICVYGHALAVSLYLYVVLVRACVGVGLLSLTALYANCQQMLHLAVEWRQTAVGVRKHIHTHTQPHSQRGMRRNAFVTWNDAFEFTAQPFSFCKFSFIFCSYSFVVVVLGLVLAGLLLPYSLRWLLRCRCRCVALGKFCNIILTQEYCFTCLVVDELVPLAELSFTPFLNSGLINILGLKKL